MAGDTNKLFAIVLDGQVISTPYFQSVIANGTSQITGDFSEDEAKSLATSLKYGALPITFDKEQDHHPDDRALARRRPAPGRHHGGHRGPASW